MVRRTLVFERRRVELDSVQAASASAISAGAAACRTSSSDSPRSSASFLRTIAAKAIRSASSASMAVLVAGDAVDGQLPADGLQRGRPQHQVDPLAAREPQPAEALVHVVGQVALADHLQDHVGAQQRLDLQQAVVADQAVRRVEPNRSSSVVMARPPARCSRSRRRRRCARGLLLLALAHLPVLEHCVDGRPAMRSTATWAA
jgi:hypothetical protein